MSILLLIGSYSFAQVKNEKHNLLSSREQQLGYTLLFDGKSSGGWRGVKSPSFPSRGWEIKNGELSTVPDSAGNHSGNGGDIVTNDRFKYFDLTLEFKISPGGNSGIKYFVNNLNGSSLGLEFQILDDSLNDDAKAGRDGNHICASLYDMIPADKSRAKEFPAGQWNSVRLVVYPNNRVVHYLNGTIVVDYIKGSPSFLQLLAKSKYSKIPGFADNLDGHILLQDHGHRISFRNIKIMKL